MAKQPTPPTEATQSLPTPPTEATQSLATTIVLKKDWRVGDLDLRAGDVLAEVRLQPEVSIGFLARAIQDDIAGIA